MKIPGVLIILILGSSPAWAQDAVPMPESRPWSLELPVAFPEGIGVDLQYAAHPWLALHAFYHLPTPVRVETRLRSRKLVDRDGFIIRSPDIDLPFDVKLGPHQGAGLRLFPFASAFYLGLDLESRRVDIKSFVQSRLEIIDATSRMLTNTLFQAQAVTHTQQMLLRPTLGYRWSLEDSDYFFAFACGWSRPVQAHSRVVTHVRVRNPEASDPSDVEAQNLDDAEEQQGQVIQQKLEDELQKFERKSLPFFGVSFGKTL